MIDKLRDRKLWGELSSTTVKFTAQINQLAVDTETSAVLEYLCSESNKLYNCTLYLARQLFFKTHTYANKYWLATELKLNRHFRAIHSVMAQQTCLGVGEAIKGYRELLKLWHQGELPDKPKFPNYRSHGLFQVSCTKQSLKLIDGQVRIPLGKSCKTWFGLCEVFIPFPDNLTWSEVKELQIVPRALSFDAVWVCKTQGQKLNLNPKNVLSVDHGLDNWLTCVSNVAPSIIIDGLHLKSINQFYNKRIATIKAGKTQAFWCRLLDQLMDKRRRQMRDAVNKAARMVINHCIEHDIGTVVFGWNKGQKQNANMGRKTNQKFVQIPTAKLKSRIQQLCEQLGLEFVEQEESYTSQASVLDLDEIPVFGEKPESWKASGRRVKRGLYRSADGTLINADCNGAWNIGRKSKVAGMQCRPSRGITLTMPRRLRLWNMRSTA